MTESESDEWEYDERRWLICKDVLQDGEELVWEEYDVRFPYHYRVKKTLRRLNNGFTFLVQSLQGAVLTVGTAYYV